MSFIDNNSNLIPCQTKEIHLKFIEDTEKPYSNLYNEDQLDQNCLDHKEKIKKIFLILEGFIENDTSFPSKVKGIVISSILIIPLAILVEYLNFRRVTVYSFLFSLLIAFMACIFEVLFYYKIFVNKILVPARNVLENYNKINFQYKHKLMIDCALNLRLISTESTYNSYIREESRILLIRKVKFDGDNRVNINEKDYSERLFFIFNKFNSQVKKHYYITLIIAVIICIIWLTALVLLIIYLVPIVKITNFYLKILVFLIIFLVLTGILHVIFYLIYRKGEIILFSHVNSDKSALIKEGIYLSQSGFGFKDYLVAIYDKDISVDCELGLINW